MRTASHSVPPQQAWYAVGQGHFPGYYLCDEHCRLAYEGYSHARHRKFKSFNEAYDYVKSFIPKDHEMSIPYWQPRQPYINAQHAHRQLKATTTNNTAFTTAKAQRSHKRLSKAAASPPSPKQIVANIRQQHREMRRERQRRCTT